MKQRIDTYSFDPTNSQLTLIDFDYVHLAQLLLVVDVTKNQVLFNFSDTTLTATVSRNVITFVGASMVGLASTDEVLVIYNVHPLDPQYETILTGWDGMNFLPLSMEKHIDRGRLRISDPRISEALERQVEMLEDIRDLLFKIAN